MADKLVPLKIVDAILTMTVQWAQKNELHPHLTKYWKVPPHRNVTFVAATEDVPTVVQRLAYDLRFPVVCMDESSKQVVGAQPRQPAEQCEIELSALSALPTVEESIVRLGC